MELEKQVCSLELAKKLKRLRVKQESLFYWFGVSEDSGEDDLLTFKTDMGGIFQNGAGFNKKYYGQENVYSAFTVAELVALLAEKGINDKINLTDISADYLANKLISHYEKSKV